MQTHFDIIIIGAGIAALSAIKAIRETDQTSSILLVSDEDRLPYKRTKINKMLDSGFQKDDFILYTNDDYNAKKVQLIYDKAIELIPGRMQIITKSGAEYSGKKILITTGKKPNQIELPNIPPELIHCIYRAADSEKLLRSKSTNFLVIGGGVEGIEMTDQLVKLGKKVLLVHNSEVLLEKHLSSRMSEQIRQVLQRNGVTILTDPHIEKHISRAESNFIYTNQHQVFSFEEVVMCIGASPSIDIARNTIIRTSNGIMVDNHFETSVKGIYAAGDVAILPDGSGSSLWHEAEAQGFHAGKCISGETWPYIRKNYRLKLEAFKTFIFSQNKPINPEQFDIIFESNKLICREIYLKNSIIQGIAMINDKERSKIYEKAVWENWDLKKFQFELPLL